MEKLEYKIAKGLLDIEAVRLSPEKPFLWASGLHSPIYCDNRKALSYPEFRKTICESMIEVIKADFKKVDVIAGVATGAIAYGAIVAEMLGKPKVSSIRVRAWWSSKTLSLPVRAVWRLWTRFSSVGYMSQA